MQINDHLDKAKTYNLLTFSVALLANYASTQIAKLHIVNLKPALPRNPISKAFYLYDPMPLKHFEIAIKPSQAVPMLPN